MKQTSLYPIHKSLNAKWVSFAGWEMPLSYGSILKEHQAVRTAVGIFDVAHMGELFFSGKDVYPALNYLISNRVPAVEKKLAVYSGLLNEKGCFIDDVIAGMLSPERGWMVVNAANEEKDFTWITEQLALAKKQFNWDVSVSNESAAYSLLAIQGKTALALLRKLFPGLAVLDEFKPFSMATTTFAGAPLVLTCTGYTGEEGVECMLPHAQAPQLFQACLDLGAAPCGLGARDSLRIEKGYSLYGNEIDETTHAWEAGLGWTVKLKKEAFIGKASLAALKGQDEAALAKGETLPGRRLRGLLIEGAAPVREKAKVVALAEELELGIVTSGVWSPVLKRPIALAYIANHYKGDSVRVRMRERYINAMLTKRVFV